jgi:AcrR family transcriptional regulator
VVPPKTSTTAAATKPLRVDARRNYDGLLAAGRIVFAQAGADAPFDDVAREAGVGRGTLYRHFPTREHLFAAIIQDRVDLLEIRARELLQAPDAWEAVAEWLRLFDRIATAYGGMSARVARGLAESGSPVAAACTPMKTAFRRLFARAQKEGRVRSDVTSTQVLTMVGSLPKHPHSGDTIRPYLDIVLSGLKPPSEG